MISLTKILFEIKITISKPILRIHHKRKYTDYNDEDFKLDGFPEFIFYPNEYKTKTTLRGSISRKYDTKDFEEYMNDKNIIFTIRNNKEYLNYFFPNWEKDFTIVR